MERRALLATLLVVLIFLVWQYLFLGREAPAPPKKEAPPPIQEESPAPKIPPQPPRFAPTEKLSLPEREVIVETDLLRVILSTRGGIVKSWQLKRYKLEEGNPVELVASPQPADSYAPLASWVGDEPRLPIYQVDKGRLTLLSPSEKGAITFTHVAPSGLLVEKTLNFRWGDYQVQVGLKVKNLGGGDLFVAPKLVWGPGFRESMVQKAAPITPTIWADGRRVEQPLEKLKEKVMQEGRISWTALHDTYFAAALIPLREGAKAFIVKGEGGQPTTGLIGGVKRLQPGGEAETLFAVYAGPKELDRLRAFGHDLDGLVNLGWFDFLARPALYFLKFIHRYTRNYGIAIIALSVLIKLFSYPLTYKSLKSMQAMQQLQPKLAALKEKYKNNPKKMNEEMMELYKRHGVNPMSGCLPMLLQFPIFIAIYNVLAHAVELWRAPLDGYWIKDLSTKDPYYILPILMGVSMFVQQKMTPQAGDPKQAQLMLYMMPAIMTFVFWNLPSGLNLYWTVFNILSIGQQYLFNQKMAQASTGGRKAA